MKKFIVVSVALALIMLWLIPFANAALISVVWEDRFDSADIDKVVIPTPGTYDISLMVSEIDTGDDGILELQFDLVASDGLEFSPILSAELSYGPAVTGWGVKMGGAVENQQNIYREFSTEWGNSSSPLQNGLLVSGIALTIPESSFLPGVTHSLEFGNAKGDYAKFLEFADMEVTCVPIPPTLFLLASGLIGLAGISKNGIKSTVDPWNIKCYILQHITST